MKVNRRCLLAASVPALVLLAPPLPAADQQKPGTIRAEMDGLLGNLVQQQKKHNVSASILAGGGELYLDTSRNKDASKEIQKLVEKHLARIGSSVFIPTRIRVKGNLEFRQVKSIGENNKESTTGIWVLVVESLTAPDNP